MPTTRTPARAIQPQGRLRAWESEGVAGADICVSSFGGSHAASRASRRFSSYQRHELSPISCQRYDARAYADSDHRRAMTTNGTIQSHSPPWLRSLGISSWLLVGFVLGIVGLIWLLAQTSTIVMPVIFAAVLGAVAGPAVTWLEHHRI